MKWIAKIQRMFLRVALAAGAFALAAACDDFDSPVEHGSTPYETKSRVPAANTRKVLLVYSAGYNSLQSYLKEDLEDIREGYLPGGRIKDDVLLVLSHLNTKSRDYTTPIQPVLYRLYRGLSGDVVADTLIRYDHQSVVTPAFFTGVLDYVRETFPAKSYGMVFSSHASGWLPPTYYSNPESKYFDTFTWNAPRRRASSSFWPEAPDGPAVKSIGQEQIGDTSSEMSLKEFATACSLHFDYILFDACLMGGVEVAYELRDVCDKVGFSQAEVLAEGFDYKMLTHHLLENEIPDPEAVCKDYFTYYDTQKGTYRSATISLINCKELAPLADVCRTLFETYRAPIAGVNWKQIQNFGRRMSDGGDRSWYFDLKDILVQVGASAQDLAALQAALDRCVIYKAATPILLGSIPINAFCGLTMYLPAYGTPYLDGYYRDNVSWNDATMLINLI